VRNWKFLPLTYRRQPSDRSTARLDYGAAPRNRGLALDNRRVPLNATERAQRRGGYPYYGANGQVDTIDDYLFDGDYILLAEDGGYFDDLLRDVAYEVSGKFWVNNHAHILSPKGRISQRFVTHALNNLDWLPFVGGTTRLKLTQEGMRQVKIVLPPLAEQRRIVAKLDALQQRSKRARDELHKLLVLCEKARNAVVRREVQRLTSDCGADSFGSLLTLLTSGSRGWSEYYDRGTAVFVLAANVKPLKFDPAPRQHIDPPRKSADARRSRVAKNDLLLTIVGAGTGDICCVHNDYDDYFVCQSVALARLAVPEMAPFYAYWFNTPGLGQGEIADAAYRAARPHLSFEQIRAFKVPIIDRDRAEAAVRRIKVATSKVDRLDAEARSALALLGRLDQAILTNAFRGELVPQDPNDVPASVLLDRIRAERAAQTKPTRRAA
jgi:type I restriction enzyme S subunit